MRSTWLHIVLSFTLAGTLILLAPGYALHICLGNAHVQTDCCHTPACSAHTDNCTDGAESLTGRPCCLEIEAPATTVNPTEYTPWKIILHGIIVCSDFLNLNVADFSITKNFYLSDDFPPPPIDIRNITCRINC